MTIELPRTVGVLHPGSMGSAVGAAARAAGSRVVWVSEDRSPATHARADADGLEDVHWLNALVNQSTVIFSICPPASAEEVAESVTLLGFDNLYVDANAISPATARRIAARVQETGADFVDGGIVGGPPREGGGRTRLYLSGPAAPRVAALFDGSPLQAVALDAPAGAASALKMAYAAWTKGTSALLANIIALAMHEDVLEALEDLWGGAGGDLNRRATGLGSAAAKAWRWVGEMEEIAGTFADAGLPPGFHEAAAEVYRRLERFKDDPDAPGGADLAKWLLQAE